MSSETLLKDLCAICHVNTIKYTCPRCGTHTCSLPCVKKHKTWAQCSGERNPAEYRKRADLATPSSIDKDFNFITNVERSITRADEDVLGKGINLAPARQLKRCDAKPKWEAEAEERGITVVKAPKGLTRGKQNKSHWVGPQKCIMWTIEWVCVDDQRVFAQCLEVKSIGEAFSQTFGRKGMKRKRKQSGDSALRADKMQKDSQSTSTRQVKGHNEGKEQDQHENPGQTTTVLNEPLAGLYFYLHKPNIPSRTKCLIPLTTDQLLRDVLDGQMLLEFPTIYVRFEPPEQLAAPFMTETEYKQLHGNDIPVDVTAKLEDGEIEESSAAALPTNLDSQKVLEVLAKDLAG